MRRILYILTGMSLLASAHAQYVTLGVERDEGEVPACYQYVALDATPDRPIGLLIGFIVEGGSAHTIDFVRTELAEDDLVYGSAGPTPGDEVEVFLTDRRERWRLPVVYGGSDATPQGTYDEYAVAGVDADFLEMLVAASGDVEVHVSHGDRRAEIDFPRDFRRSFLPFVGECL